MLIATYIPPHLRKLRGDGEADAKLARKLKGLLNKLSEQNLDSILKEVENLYRTHRRHGMLSANLAQALQNADFTFKTLPRC